MAVAGCNVVVGHNVFLWVTASGTALVSSAFFRQAGWWTPHSCQPWVCTGEGWLGDAIKLLEVRVWSLGCLMCISDSEGLHERLEFIILHGCAHQLKSRLQSWLRTRDDSRLRKIFMCRQARVTCSCSDARSHPPPPQTVMNMMFKGMPLHTFNACIMFPASTHAGWGTHQHAAVAHMTETRNATMLSRHSQAVSPDQHYSMEHHQHLQTASELLTVAANHQVACNCKATWQHV